MKKFLCAAIAILMTLTAFAVSAPEAAGAFAASSQGETRYAKKKINLFAKKSTSSKKLCSIPKGGEMTLLETSGAWANVIYEASGGTEYTGFVKKANISKTKPGEDATATPAPTPTPDPGEEPTPTPTSDPDATPTPTPTPSPSASPFNPGGGGGRRPSGSGGSGSSDSSGEQSVTDLLGITPGKALTSGHKSGSYSSVPYGAIGLSVSSGAMTELTVDSNILDITLAREGEGAAFTAEFYSDGENEILALTPVDDAQSAGWHLGGSALATLNKSGVDMIILGLGASASACVSTSRLFSGVAYDALRASGVPESGIGLELDAQSGFAAVFAVYEGQRRELSSSDDKVFYARGLTVVGDDTLANALQINNAEG